jgi:hypothetical protein
MLADGEYMLLIMYAQCDSQLLENNDGLMVGHEFLIPNKAFRLGLRQCGFSTNNFRTDQPEICVYTLV